MRPFKQINYFYQKQNFENRELQRSFFEISGKIKGTKFYGIIKILD